MLLPQLRLSYDFEKFFPEEDDELGFYLNHRDKFETDNDFLLIALQPKLQSKHWFETLDSLTQQLGRIQNIESSLSITNYQVPISTAFGWTVGTRFYYADSSTLAENYRQLLLDPNIKGNLISTDGSSQTIILRNKPEISKKKSDRLLHEVDSVLSTVKDVELHIAGKIHGQYHYIKKMAEELVMFAAISVILLSLFLFLTFRTVWGVWVPLIVVAVTLLWLLGFITLIGEELNMLCTILPTIIFVVGIADSVHILEKYVHELRNGKSKLLALIDSYRHVGIATLLTAFTNAVGFITLCVSDIEPVRKFGIFTAIGIMFAFLLTYLLLPAALLFLKRPKIAERKHSDTYWSRVLPRLFAFVLRNRRAVAFTALGICVLSVVGLMQIKINNYLLEDWDEDDPQKQDYVFFEKNYSGVRPVEFSIQVSDLRKDLLDTTVLKEVDQFQNYLEQVYGAGALASPLNLVKTLNRSQHNQEAEFFSLPDSSDYQAIRPTLKKAYKNAQARAYISKDLKTCRISGRITDFGGYEFKYKNQDLNTFISKEIDPKIIQIKQTGMAMLIDRNNENLAGDIGYELGLSLLMVAAMMGLLFRNLRIIFIALIPNLIPLLVVAGFMGFAGIDLKVSTSLIFSIAFGIAVDDTIHFMSNLKIELDKGRSPFYALKSTYLSTGKAITITNLILLSGFFSLILSSFASTFYLGLLVSLTLLIALAAELTIMPLMFVWIYKRLGVRG